MMSEQVNELFSALSKAQATIQPALKDKSNPFFKTKYCDLSSVWVACRESLTNNGLCVTQTVVKNDSGMILITTLGHSSGQWMRSEMPILLGKMDPQGLGSSITYARRYSLAAMVGVAPDDDDDGEKAQQSFRKQANEPVKSSIEQLKQPIELVKSVNVSLISKEMVDELINLQTHVTQECKDKAKKYMNEELKVFEFDKLNQDQYKKIHYGFTANIQSQVKDASN